jgi:type 3 multicopper oxidase
MQFREPGTYTFVNHRFAEMERGAMGKIKVTDK